MSLFPTAHQTKSALEVLCGLRLLRIKCMGMFRSIQFSAKNPSGLDYGSPGDWALHVDCAWRLDRENSTLTGSDDWFELENHTLPPEDWDGEKGGSLQEVVLRSVLDDSDTSERIIRNRTDGFVVQGVEADDWGGCIIAMSGGFALRIFPDAAARECWRLLKPGDLDSHFVIPPESKA